ncbi:hypothetical protein IAU60_001383 [Kwoniella sp. DSM 27419]
MAPGKTASQKSSHSDQESDVKPDVIPATPSAASATDTDGGSEYAPPAQQEGEDEKPHVESDSDPKDKSQNKKRKRGSPQGKGPGKQLKSPSKSPTKNGHKAHPKAWSGDEDWALFQELHPKVSKPDWAGVARVVGNGRDAKSCQNRYAVFQKRLEGVVRTIGGA